MTGLAKAEALIEQYESADKSNRKAGTGRIAKDVVTDPKKLKEYQREQAIYAYFKLLVLTSNVKFQRQHMREYMELCKYLYEVSFGKPAQMISADLGENLPLNVTFQIAPKPELDGKTINTRQITEGISRPEKETS